MYKGIPVIYGCGDFVDDYAVDPAVAAASVDPVDPVDPEPEPQPTPQVVPLGVATGLRAKNRELESENERLRREAPLEAAKAVGSRLLARPGAGCSDPRCHRFPRRGAEPQ